MSDNQHTSEEKIPNLLSICGLTSEQVNERKKAGQVNEQPQESTHSVSSIIRKNTLTLFNFINLVLGIAIALVGELKNTLFLSVVICNTAIGIYQELRSKKTLDKLKILAQSQVTAVRDGVRCTVEQKEIVLDDILFISGGNQICADAVVIRSNGLEVDESLLTGEPDRIHKQSGDGVLSGSYVTGGNAYVKVSAIGEDNYATALTIEAKKANNSSSQLLRTLRQIIRILAVIIVPLGIVLFYKQYTSGAALEASILGASASMLGMIPEGLVLLTGVTLMLGAVSLAKHKALVQALPSIETLARVNVLCLDKTGTITDGTLKFEEILLLNDFDREEAWKILSELMGSLQDTNSTAEALRNFFGASNSWNSIINVPFSSERKWSGASFSQKGTFIIGAPGFVFGEEFPYKEEVHRYAVKGYRVLCLAFSEESMVENRLPSALACKALLIISDTIREDAPDTFRYFIEEGVTLKVISGDDAATVSSIARRAGLPDAKNVIDMSKVGNDVDYSIVANQHTVFARVSPNQKKELIRGLKQNGYTTCMTGDGVNDLPAMKEADCSVSMVGGSDAARSACDFVLLTSNFSSMVHILKEGRRVINNIEKVSSLYLVKTIYSTILAILYIFLPFPYPFAPLQLTPINIFTVGIPSFILALTPSYHRPEGRFLPNVLENSFPAALTIVFDILMIQLAGYCFNLTRKETSTMQVLLTGAVGFVLLIKVSKPLTVWLKIMIILLISGFAFLFTFFGDFFMLESIFTRNAFFYIPLVYASPHLFLRLNQCVHKLEDFFMKMAQKIRKKKSK